jgi:hypothetical protein
MQLAAAGFTDAFFNHGRVEPLKSASIKLILRLENKRCVSLDPEGNQRRYPRVVTRVRHFALKRGKSL